MGEAFSQRAISLSWSTRHISGTAAIMSQPTSSKPSELHLTLDAAHGELVRSFVREAALAEDIPAALAACIASDAATAWQAVAEASTGMERVSIALSVPHHEVRARLLLPGHAQFATTVAALGTRLPAGAGMSWRESGIDGWEVALHRSLSDGHGLSAAAAVPAPAAGNADPATITIDLARKSDAAAIARCFLAVYGHDYVHPDVFSPRRYWARVEAGELIPVVARDAHGDVIGHLALEREADAHVAERGEAVVLPAARGHHLLEQMTDRLSEEAPRHGLLGVYAEPLTIHTFSQRNDVRAGMPVCAVLLGANPESFRPKDIACPTAGQRQSYLRTFRFVQPPAARRLHIAGPYEPVVKNIYDTLGVTVELAGREAPTAGDSRTALKVNDRGYGVIRFERIGSNCSVELAQALRDTRSLGARSLQLSARVSDPALPDLIDAARTLGFFFCGLGPGFADGEDMLLLQMLTEPLDTAKLQLFTDEAKALVAFIDADRRATAAFGA